MIVALSLALMANLRPTAPTNRWPNRVVTDGAGFLSRSALNTEDAVTGVATTAAPGSELFVLKTASAIVPNRSRPDAYLGISS